MRSTQPEFSLSCPLPIQQYPRVLLAHGGGGKLMHQLIEQMFVPAFRNPLLGVRHDGAVFDVNGARLAFTTDSYVVRPLFFPGGDIGTLAINGTVNDLAMCGARPLYLSAGFILEEGLPMETLWRVIQSMQQAAARAGIQLVTGDTKVVDKGKGDGIFINTAGVGVIEHALTIAPTSISPAMPCCSAAIWAARHCDYGVARRTVFATAIESDCAPVAELVQTLLAAGLELHCLRDLTRGGLASALVEIAEESQRQIALTESAIPITEEVQGACEILGLDPLYLANEGRFVVFVPASQAEDALAILQAHELGAQSAWIGTVTENTPALVTMKSRIGAQRIVDMFSGEQLPRIC
ncbi:MAG: hydrogenase expression/formation protein HypE [Blastocatellia bacterium]